MRGRPHPRQPVRSFGGGRPRRPQPFAAGDPETPALYLTVRHGTEARLNRSTYAQLVEIALEGGELAVSSQGATFALVPA